MKKRIILFLSILVITFSVGVSITIHSILSKSSEVKDFSSITLPSYSLPEGSLTKEQVIENALKMSKLSLKHNQIPKNPQCVLMPYGEAEKLFLNIKPGPHPEVENTLIYVVTVDVDRRAVEEVLRWRHGAKPTIFHQDHYFINPINGEVIESGYEGTRWILPKQEWEKP